MMSCGADAILERQRGLIRALLDPNCYPHEVARIELIETHISFVILTGAFVYKIKKAVDLGFLDFTTLERRRFYCEEELRLNRQLAPTLYLDVVAIGGSERVPRIGQDPPLEFAVRMRQFSQDGLLDCMLCTGRLRAEHLDALAAEIADFHLRTARAESGSAFGTPDAIRRPAAQNFDQLRSLSPIAEHRTTLDILEAWSAAEHERLRPVFDARQRDGFVRECHGDLHLANIAVVEDRIQPFDRIEFDPNLRWIDVMSEISFLFMDLAERGRSDFAHRFLNAYLELTGDYAGLDTLRFYLVYRAMVRAKIALLRAEQERTSPQAGAAARADFARYVGYARSATCSRPALILTHGPTGSGKTFFSQHLLEAVGVIRVRSDVERKRLQGLPPLARTRAAVGAGLYGEDVTAETYARLARLAARVLGTGFPVIVDAAFLKGWQRNLLRDVAREASAPFLIVSCTAPEPVLLKRIANRAAADADPSDGTEDVLAHQLSSADDLTPEEKDVTLPVRTDAADFGSAVAQVKRALKMDG